MTSNRPPMLKLPPKITFYPYHLRGFYGKGSVSTPAVISNTILQLLFAGVLTFGAIHFNRKKVSEGKPPKTFSPEWKEAEGKKSATRKADPIHDHVPGSSVV